MSSKSTLYRRSHPEYYEKEREKDKERVKNIYHTNPEYKERVKKQSQERYYKLKQAKANVSNEED